MKSIVKNTFVILVIIFTLSDSCKKKYETACGVEQPEKNLLWLKELLPLYFCLDIYKLQYDGIEYIILADCDLLTDRMERVYTCAGIKVCSHGGIAPGSGGSGGCNLPSAFWDLYYQNKVPLFEIRNNPK